MKPSAALPKSNLASEASGSEPGELEAEWVNRARVGDERAFRSLVEIHQGRVLGLALRIVRIQAEAEDVAQEAFVRAWQALPRFRGDARFGTWLYAIVARRSFDRLAALRRREREKELPEAMPAAAAETDERARRLERLIETLSPQQRAVVTLYYYEDHSVETVAETLAIPENTVKTHLRRARALLREGWLREGGEAR